MSDKSEGFLDRFFKGLIIVGIFGLLDLIIFGAFGYAGSFVRSFILGIFGYASYGYCIGATALGLMITLGFKLKVEPKIVINYIAIVFFIACIGHVSTYAVNTELGYIGSIKAAFNTADTLGGAVFVSFLYPLSLARTFGIVFLSLILAGLVVLAIVNQLNFEIGLKLRNTKKPQASQPIYGGEEENMAYQDNYQTQTPGYMQPTLYNGDVNGKMFDDNAGKTPLFGGFRRQKQDNLTEITPIDEVQTMQMTEDEQDNILAGIDTDGNPMDAAEKELTEKRANQFMQASPFIPVEQQKAEEEPGYTPTPSPDVSDIDRLRFNSSRRANLRGEQYTPPQQEETPYNGYSNEIVDDTTSFDEPVAPYTPPIEPIIPKEPKPIVDPFETIMKAVIDDDSIAPQPKVEEKVDNTIFEEETPIVEEKKPEPFRPVPQKPAEPIKPKVEKKPEPPKPVEPPKPKRVYKKYVAPSIDMLDDFNDPEEDISTLQAKSEVLKEVLANFKINVEIDGVIKGPTFSRINFRLEAGTPVRNLISKADDIKMGLAVSSMRLLAPIPGTNMCGVEVPNKVRSKVNLKEMYKSAEYQKAISKDTGLVFALGKDINGKNFTFDLTTAPHMLVCGQTRSGKSVALNVMLISLLMRYAPEDMRLILFDPKQVEFAPFAEIPHLLIPNILYEPPKAINAMNWAVDEMERRYALLTATGTRNLEEYNARPDVKRDPTMKIPYIVIVIDEFADVVSQDGAIKKQFNNVISRLAAKARAAGIHLVLATQRPSVDIVNGTIKANMPVRMALKTTDSTNSQTILGYGGAEELLGYGDMLFMTPYDSELQRIQGAFISSENVIDVIEFIKAHNDNYFDEEIGKIINAEPQKEAQQMEMELDGEGGAGVDPQYIDALEMCIKYQKVSTSFLQTKFSVGYPKAAKIIDWMQENGYITVDGTKKIINATQADVDKLRNGDEE